MNMYKKAQSLLDFWALVPARGGSKSIKKKNIALLGGQPLIDYGVNSALQSNCFSRIVCSTDDDEIASRALELGIDVDCRPDELSSDDIDVGDVAIDFLYRQQDKIPDWLFLIQPTSPFLLPSHIKNLIKKIQKHPNALSAQTVSPVMHNSHAWNRRVVSNDNIEFVFKKERVVAHNKQRKPAYYTFGNLVAVKSQALLRGKGFFAEPSVYIEIDNASAFDVDNIYDLKIANLMLGAKNKA